MVMNILSSKLYSYLLLDPEIHDVGATPEAQ